MDLRKILFVGGDAQKLASVQIRCVDVAERLGCAYILNIRSVDQIPGGYRAYVCVKASLAQDSLPLLHKKGKIVWDIIDALPPTDQIALYLASTKTVQRDFSGYGRVEWVPHHHCNNSSRFNSPKNRDPGWIGNKQWLPQLSGFKYAKYPVQEMTRADVVRAMRKIGIGLNFRGSSNLLHPKHPIKLRHDFHVSLNSGIKLINCVGFGIPSISAEEPAYREVEGGCTIFCSPEDCSHWVKELRENDVLYNQLRNNCIQEAKRFHLDAIARIYRKQFRSL